MQHRPWLAVLTCAAASCAAPSEQFVTGYVGRYTDASLPENILFWSEVEFEEATIGALAWSRTLSPLDAAYRWEFEANVAQWFQRQDHQEINGLFVLRHTECPWDHWIDTSFAFGNGLSFATSVPDLESEFHPDTDSTKLLYHIAVEVEFALPGAPNWWTLLRVHHRSGVFGTFSGVDGGSNAIALGLRAKI